MGVFLTLFDSFGQGTRETGRIIEVKTVTVYPVFLSSFLNITIRGVVGKNQPLVFKTEQDGLFFSPVSPMARVRGEHPGGDHPAYGSAGPRRVHTSFRRH